MFPYAPRRRMNTLMVSSTDSNFSSLPTIGVLSLYFSGSILNRYLAYHPLLGAIVTHGFFYFTNPTISALDFSWALEEPSPAALDFNNLHSQWIGNVTLCARVWMVKMLDLEASKMTLNWTALLTTPGTMPLINNKRKKTKETSCRSRKAYYKHATEKY